MGKTVLAYRLALEFERWKGFKKALTSEEDREAFEELMDMCRSYALEDIDSIAPIVFEPMAMSILLAQQERMGILEKELAAIKPDKAQTPAIPEPPVTIPRA
jgi:hypothetical protein